MGRINRNLWREDDGSLSVLAGARIHETIQDAIALAAQAGSVEFEFNDVVIKIEPDSDPSLIQRDWSRAMNGYIDKKIGPHPNPVLTDEEQASDARIESQNQRRRSEREEEWAAEARTKCAAVETRLLDSPGIELVDEAGWRDFKDKNQDPYGGAIISYAERWARLMQVEMTSGKGLEDVADHTSHEADLEGVTGFMYGCVVSTLARFWKYGEPLRRWHNLSTQVGNEGEKANESDGVLNPALLNLAL